MYEAVQDFLREFVKPQKALSGPETERLEHHAFLIQKLGMGGMYVGGEGYLDEVDKHVSKSRNDYKNKHLLVLGEPGMLAATKHLIEYILNGLIVETM